MIPSSSPPFWAALESSGRLGPDLKAQAYHQKGEDDDESWWITRLVVQALSVYIPIGPEGRVNAVAPDQPGNPLASLAWNDSDAVVVDGQGRAPTAGVHSRPTAYGSSRDFPSRADLGFWDHCPPVTEG